MCNSPKVSGRGFHLSAPFLCLRVKSTASISTGEPPTPSDMSKVLREDLSDFQIREKSFAFANSIQLGARVSGPMKQRLARLSMAQGVSESQLIRFLIMRGLAEYDIDALKAL